MPLQFIREDIASISVDCIVNILDVKSIQEKCICTSDFGATEKPQLQVEYNRFLRCRIGQTIISDGHDLPAKHIIHTVEPKWQGCKFINELQLRSCYRNSLKLAKSFNLSSIAFPLILFETPIFSKEKLLAIAVSVIRSFLKKSDILVYLVINSSESFQLQMRNLKSLTSYIDVKTSYYRRTTGTNSDFDMELLVKCKSIPVYSVQSVEGKRSMASILADAKLQKYVDHVADSFTEMLIHLIDRKGYQDSHVYQRANIDRRLFSKIRSNPHYKPSKNTALALAIALRLNLDQTKDLIARAGYALSPASKFDLIVEYFICDGNYDIREINEALFAFDESLLGA